MSQVIEIPDGSRGFDGTATLTLPTAKLFRAANFLFGLRYIRRDHWSTSDLSLAEIGAFHLAGLAVAPVQHFGPADGWTPSDQLGMQYGQNAVSACDEIGIPAGVSVLLDLEGVDPTVDVETIIRYCNRWHDVVATAKFLPAIYLGYGNRLNPDQLYRRLKFTRYVGAYNLNTDQYPAVRGICMKQHEAQPGKDRPDGVRFPIDVDIAQADALGGRITVFAPDEWGILAA